MTSEPYEVSRRKVLSLQPGEPYTVILLGTPDGNRAYAQGCDSKRCRVGSVWIDLAGGLG
jgi:hypothetical protein